LRKGKNNRWWEKDEKRSVISGADQGCGRKRVERGKGGRKALVRKEQENVSSKNQVVDVARGGNAKRMKKGLGDSGKKGTICMIELKG